MWYAGLSILEKVYFYTAVISSAILLLQTAMVLIGGELFDGDADMDADIGDGLRLFSVRGLLAFFMVGGWAGFGFASIETMPMWAVILLSIVFGVAAFVGIAYLFRLFMKMQADGTMDINSAVGNIGDVYITIGAAQSRTGKISVIISGRLAEIDAVTNTERDLKSGEKVRVTGMLTSNVLIVEPAGADA